MERMPLEKTCGRGAEEHERGWRRSSRRELPGSCQGSSAGRGCGAAQQRGQPGADARTLDSVSVPSSAASTAACFVGALAARLAYALPTSCNALRSASTCAGVRHF
jgi:hypothetical protein